jgi:hypothetical protein
MSFQRKDMNNARTTSGNAAKPDGKTPNGKKE